MSSNKVWTATSIRELARERLKKSQPTAAPANLASALPQDSSDDFTFQWGRFQEASGSRGYLVVPRNRAVRGSELEIRQLCETLGLSCPEVIVVGSSQRPNSATYVGSGSLTEIAQRMKELECTVLVIDADLSPAQIRNVEKIIEGPVLDRQGVILGIFQRHAQSNLAQMQVELASLKYLLPRLTGIWSGLSRQRGAAGGLGGRAGGETRLELDRRVIKQRITSLNKKLKVAETTLKTQSARREGLPRAVLIGYTNAGKSMLMRALTHAQVEADSRLFSTLDTTVRPLVPPTEPRILLSDTVGFVRDLPHNLIASFKSTLREAFAGSLLLHVLDVSSDDAMEQFVTTEKVLEEIGAESIPRILVANKIDKLQPGRRRVLDEISRLIKERPVYLDQCAVSALKGEGLSELKSQLISILKVKMPKWSELS